MRTEEHTGETQGTRQENEQNNNKSAVDMQKADKYNN